MDHTKDKEKNNGVNDINYESINTSSDWKMMDSLGQSLWHDSISIHTNAGSSNVNGIVNDNLIGKSIEMGWNKGNAFLLPNANGFIPHSTVQFPTDLGFIERAAARFSCFGNGNFSDIMNQQPLVIPESIGFHSQIGGTMQDMQVGGKAKLDHRGECNGNELNIDELSKDVSTGVKEGIGIYVKPDEEGKVDKVGCSNMSNDDSQSSGGNGKNELQYGETSSKGFDTKKRKRNGQESEPIQSCRAQRYGEEADNNGEKMQKDEQNNNSSINKASKHGKQSSDPPKDGYIHVRARRGQATNSHSLAERVRREKISERMKFLQDLVPGCNKVTGKAVMLDEIINYVQSLQRQVEFLSMKLATVNPQLDFNLEELLAKDALQLRPCSSSVPPFLQNMPMAYPSLPHISQPGFIHPTLSGMVNPSDVLRRTINSPLSRMNGGGFKRSEITHGWEGDLRNVVHMSYGINAPPSENQEATESCLPPADMKVEQ